MDELKQRLRVSQDSAVTAAEVRATMAEAAAALDALEAENARLRDHVQDLIRVCEENDIHDMTLAAVAADLSLTHQ